MSREMGRYNPSEIMVSRLETPDAVRRQIVGAAWGDAVSQLPEEVQKKQQLDFRRPPVDYLTIPSLCIPDVWPELEVRASSNPQPEGFAWVRPETTEDGKSLNRVSTRVLPAEPDAKPRDWQLMTVALLGGARAVDSSKELLVDSLLVDYDMLREAGGKEVTERNAEFFGNELPVVTFHLGESAVSNLMEEQGLDMSNIDV